MDENLTYEYFEATEKADDRSPLAVTECAIACIGLLVAISGAVLSSVSTAIFGLALLAVGLGYFYTRRDESD